MKLVKVGANVGQGTKLTLAIHELVGSKAYLIFRAMQQLPHLQACISMTFF